MLVLYSDQVLSSIIHFLMAIAPALEECLQW